MNFIVTSVFRWFPSWTPQDCSIWYIEIFICSSFPCHSSTFRAFGLLSFSYEPSCMPFFLNFNSVSSIPSVLLCERCIHVSSHGRRGTFGDLVLIWLYNAFIGVFDSYLPFGIHFLAWDHLYLIYCLPCFFPWALYCHSLGHFKCDMDGASK